MADTSHLRALRAIHEGIGYRLFWAELHFFVILYKYDREVRSLYFSSLPVCVCLKVWCLFARTCVPAYVCVVPACAERVC